MRPVVNDHQGGLILFHPHALESLPVISNPAVLHSFRLRRNPDENCSAIPEFSKLPGGNADRRWQAVEAIRYITDVQ